MREKGCDSVSSKNIVEQLYIKHEKQMFSVAYAVLKNHADAEDAVQQSFAVILTKLDKLSLDEPEKARALLMLIAKNQALNIIRRRKKTVYLEDIDETAPLLTSEEFFSLSPEDIREALSSLPEEVKHIITLRFVYGFSAEETAELTALSTDAVYRRIRQARKILKEQLEVT